MAFASYLDECVDTELADALRTRGFVTRTAAEAGMLGADDERQLRYATRHGFVLLTGNGRDFRRLHRRMQTEGTSHAGIIILPQTGDLGQLELRAAMMLDWLALRDQQTSILLAWGELQLPLTQGLRLPGYTEAEFDVTLGRRR